MKDADYAALGRYVEAREAFDAAIAARNEALRELARIAAQEARDRTPAPIDCDALQILLDAIAAQEARADRAAHAANAVADRAGRTRIDWE
jgi:hypothetical protein